MIMIADDANKPSQILLIKLMVWFPMTASNGPRPAPYRICINLDYGINDR